MCTVSVAEMTWPMNAWAQLPVIQAPVPSLTQKQTYKMLNRAHFTWICNPLITQKTVK